MGSKAHKALEAVGDADGSVAQGETIQQIGFDFLSEFAAEQAFGSDPGESCQISVFCFRKFAVTRREKQVVAAQYKENCQPQRDENGLERFIFHKAAPFKNGNTGRDCSFG